MSTQHGWLRLALLFFGAWSFAIAAESELEFRGVVREGDAWLVYLHQPAANVSRWIPVGGEAAGLMVAGYDEASDRVAVVQSGRWLSLPLKPAHVALQGANLPLRLLPPAGRVAGREDPGVPEHLRALPPDTRRMLEEVRRRRAIRWPAMSTAPANSP